MPHVVELDQSGKIEQTRSDTALAFADGIEHTVLIPAQIKRRAIRELRKRGKRGAQITLSLFVNATYQLLKDHLADFDLIVIDREYEGRELDVKLMLLNLIRRDHPNYPAGKITFDQIGRKALAHKKALAVYRGEEKAGKILTLDHLINP